MLLLLRKGSLHEVHRSTDFWGEKKDLYCQVHWQGDQEPRAQICLSYLGFRVKFKGLGEFQTLKLTSCSWINHQATWAPGSQVFLIEGLALLRALLATFLFFEFRRLIILVLGSSYLAYAQWCLCKVAPGLSNQQPVLRKQNWFKVV